MTANHWRWIGFALATVGLIVILCGLDLLGWIIMGIGYAIVIVLSRCPACRKLLPMVGVEGIVGVENCRRCGASITKKTCPPN